MRQLQRVQDSQAATPSIQGSYNACHTGQLQYHKRLRAICHTRQLRTIPYEATRHLPYQAATNNTVRGNAPPAVPGSYETCPWTLSSSLFPATRPSSFC